MREISTVLGANTPVRRPAIFRRDHLLHKVQQASTSTLAARLLGYLCDGGLSDAGVNMSRVIFHLRSSLDVISRFSVSGAHETSW